MSDLIETLEREHSGIVGGSTAGRMLNCPGHYRIVKAMQEQIDLAADDLIDAAQEKYANGTPAMAAAIQNAEKLRGSLNKSSIYADEGTKLHQVMEYLVDMEVDRNAVLADATVDRMFDELEIDEARMFDAVIPAYNMFNDFLDAILAEDGDEYMLKIETRVTFPGIDDAFGTCDVLIRTSKRTVVWDWKFGAGVPVAASYKVEDVPVVSPNHDSAQPIEAEYVEYGNDQLMFYARAALETHPDYFGFERIGDEDANAAWPIELVICQPRCADEIGRYTANISELLDFEADMIDAVAEALDMSKPATMKIGKWCKFAPCVAQCPLHLNGPVAGVAIAEKLKKLQLRAAAAKEGDTPVEVFKDNTPALTYPEALSAMLQLAEIAEPYFAEAHKQAHAFMEAGGVVPGYKLVPKRAAHDSWQDPVKAEQFLARTGLSLGERRKPMEPITPAVARTKLKALKDGDPKMLKLLEKYVKQGVSSGTNIAREDNPKEAVKPLATNVAELAGKLKQIGAA